MLRRNGDSREGCWTPAPGGAFFKFRGSKLGCGRGLRSREDAVWRTDLGPGRAQAPHWQLTRGAAPAPPGCLCFCLHHLPKCSDTRPILFNMCPWETSPPPLPSLELLRRLFLRWSGAGREQTRRPPQSHQPQCTTCFPITWQAPQRGSKFVRHPEKKKQRPEKAAVAPRQFEKLCSLRGGRKLGGGGRPGILRLRPTFAPRGPALLRSPLPNSPPLLPPPSPLTHLLPPTLLPFFLCSFSPGLPPPPPASPSPLLLLVLGRWDLEAPAARQERVHSGSRKEGGAQGLKPGGLPIRGLD